MRSGDPPRAQTVCLWATKHAQLGCAESCSCAVPGSKVFGQLERLLGRLLNGFCFRRDLSPRVPCLRSVATLAAPTTIQGACPWLPCFKIELHLSNSFRTLMGTLQFSR